MLVVAIFVTKKIMSKDDACYCGSKLHYFVVGIFPRYTLIAFKLDINLLLLSCSTFGKNLQHAIGTC